MKLQLQPVCLLHLLLLIFSTTAIAQTTYIYGTFSGAIYVSSAGLSQAVQAQCPADHPQRCDGIQEPDYCCGSGSYCALASGNVVGCCVNGQTCSGNIGGYTTWYPAVVTVTTYVTGGGVIVASPYTTTTTIYGQPAATPPYVYTPATTVNTATGYCSTLTANGPGLPTVRQGGCGLILIVSKADSTSASWRYLATLLVSWIILYTL